MDASDNDEGVATAGETMATGGIGSAEEALQAAAFRRLVAHLRANPDVQNIDLMNLAGFCRNCLANWYQDAAEAAGTPIDKAAARERIYGMPYDEYKKRHQQEASPEQAARFAARAEPGGGG